MTEGHKHRMLHVRSFDTRLVRLLRFPLLHKPASTTAQWRKIEASPYPYGPCFPELGMDSYCWTLSPLGILHRWTGLTLTDEPKHPHDIHCGDETCTEDHGT